jgi:DNA-binding MarR family transcriptional regulator
VVRRHRLRPLDRLYWIDGFIQVDSDLNALNRVVSVTSKARTTDTKALRDHIVDRTCRLADAMIRMSSWHMQERWKLRQTDFRLLNVLDGEESLSVNEISRRALVDQAWVSRSLRALETRKLVERRSDPEDSRLTRVSLTKRGRETLDQFRPWAAWSEKVLLDGIDERKLKALLDQLEANTESLMNTLKSVPRKLPKSPPGET